MKTMVSIRAGLLTAALAAVIACTIPPTSLAQNWRYSWRLVSGAPARSGGSLVLDAANRRVVVYGGADPSGSVPVRSQWVVVGETTARYLQPSWRPMQTTGEDDPGWRRDHTAVYDSAHGRMILFGGYDEAGSLATGTYALDLRADQSGRWSLLDASGGPAPRWGHGAVYDALRDRMLVFGGRSARGEENDLWALDLGATAPEWHQLTSSEGPSPRYWHSLSTVPGTTRNVPIVAYGGISDCTVGDDLWVLEFGEDGDVAHWRQLQPAGNRSPGPRFGHAAGFIGYDLYIVGGQNGRYEYDPGDITWVLRLLPLLRGQGVAWRSDPTVGGPTGMRRGASLIWMNGLYPGWAFSLFGGHAAEPGDRDAAALWAYLMPGDPLPPPDFTPPAATPTPARTAVTSVPPGVETCPTPTAVPPTATPVVRRTLYLPFALAEQRSGLRHSAFP